MWSIRKKPISTCQDGTKKGGLNRFPTLMKLVFYLVLKISDRILASYFEVEISIVSFYPKNVPMNICPDQFASIVKIRVKNWVSHMNMCKNKEKSIFVNCFLLDELCVNFYETLKIHLRKKPTFAIIIFLCKKREVLKGFCNYLSKKLDISKFFLFSLDWHVSVE